MSPARFDQQHLAKHVHGYRCHPAVGVPLPWPIGGIETKLGLTRREVMSVGGTTLGDRAITASSQSV